ncbi:MAG: hypothetical protein SFT81_04900 [Candidatus Caenarcaniphilales bacterium]|nr:hypothetical protein [Candidatus Caenarcaniphilales bacterium]
MSTFRPFGLAGLIICLSINNCLSTPVDLNLYKINKPNQAEKLFIAGHPQMQSDLSEDFWSDLPVSSLSRVAPELNPSEKAEIARILPEGIKARGDSGYGDWLVIFSKDKLELAPHNNFRRRRGYVGFGTPNDHETYAVELWRLTPDPKQSKVIMPRYLADTWLITKLKDRGFAYEIRSVFYPGNRDSKIKQTEYITLNHSQISYNRELDQLEGATNEAFLMRPDDWKRHIQEPLPPDIQARDIVFPRFHYWWRAVRLTPVQFNRLEKDMKYDYRPYVDRYIVISDFMSYLGFRPPTKSHP